VSKRRAKPMADNGGHVADIADPVNLTDAAALTGLSERTLRRRMKAGKLQFRRDGRACLLSRAELEAIATARGRPVNGGQTADNGGQAPDNSGAGDKALLATVIELNRELAQTRNLLTAGEAQKNQDLTALREQKDRELEAVRGELADTRDRATRAETGKRWAVIIAGVLGAAAVALVVVLVVTGGAP